MITTTVTLSPSDSEPVWEGNISGSRLLATVAAGTRDRKLAQLGPKRALVDTTLLQARRLSLWVNNLHGYTHLDTDALSGRFQDQAYRWARWPGRRFHRRARLDRVESERKSAHLMNWYDNLS